MGHVVRPTWPKATPITKHRTTMLYLLRFSKPLGNERKRAQHYLGSCEDGRLDERLAEHR